MQNINTEFNAFITNTYAEEPSAELLTDVEVREWRNYLCNTRKFSAVTVNLHLSAIRSLVRHYGGMLQVRGISKVVPPISPLNGRELGRLLAATNGDGWSDKRNKAILELIVRAGLRVSEVAALQITDITISPRSGEVFVRHGKGIYHWDAKLEEHWRSIFQSDQKEAMSGSSLAKAISLYQ